MIYQNNKSLKQILVCIKLYTNEKELKNFSTLSSLSSLLLIIK